MRVIAGSARRTQLKTLEGMDTRPTTDRIKETLFNMIAPYLYDSIFLDLFAGSGGIGIEALSRGAMEAVFVEKNPKAMACVKENLQKTHFERKGMTMQMDVMTALYKLEGEKQFDYIFYNNYDEASTKELIKEYSKDENAKAAYKPDDHVLETSLWSLPLCGMISYNDGTNIADCGSTARYVSSTCSTDSKAYYCNINASAFNFANGATRGHASAVRCVKE